MNSGRGLALLSQVIWELENSALGANCLHDNRSPEYCVGDRRSRPSGRWQQTSLQPYLQRLRCPDCVTRLGPEPDEPPLWLKVYQRLLNWGTV